MLACVLLCSGTKVAPPVRSTSFWARSGTFNSIYVTNGTAPEIASIPFVHRGQPSNRQHVVATAWYTVVNELVSIYAAHGLILLGRVTDCLPTGKPSRYTPCPWLKKNCAKFFLSQVRQMSTNCDNSWHRDSTNDTFMWGALIFHLT